MYDLPGTTLFMDLNTIDIPELLISELYRDNLLATEIKATVATTQPSAPVSPLMHGSATSKESALSKEPASAKEPTSSNQPAPLQKATSANAPDATESRPAPAKESALSKEPIATTAPIPGTVLISTYKYLGHNQKQITIIIQSPGIAFLPDDQLAVLTKMLEACRMNIGDVAIINHANTPVAITMLREQLHPSIILLFGIQPVDIRLPINFPVFKIQAYDACTYLCAPSLSELVPPTDESRILKSKLWVCLKTLFAI
jgi:hypothetical protein